MNRTRWLLSVSLFIALMPGLIPGPGAWADDDDDDDHGRGRYSRDGNREDDDDHDDHQSRRGHTGGAVGVSNAVYSAACGECHRPFYPGLLPASSWEQILMNTTDHFGGESFDLDPADLAELKTFLAANGRSGVAGDYSPGKLPVSGSRRIAKEHDEISPSVFKRKGVGSRSNCTACHGAGAEFGRFNEHRVNIPPH